jgi:hypothetical protein
MPAVPLDDTALARACWAAALIALDVRLPLRQSVEETGVVVDDEGEDLFTVDVWKDRPDDHAGKIADCLAALVNLAAGYVPVATGDKTETIRWEPAFRQVAASPPHGEASSAPTAGGAA